MSWFKNLNFLRRQAGTPEALPPKPAATPDPTPEPARPAAPRAAATRPPSALLKAQAAAAKAAAEIVRREQAAKAAKDVLASIGHTPRDIARDILESMHGPKAEALKRALSKAAPGAAKPGLLSRERKALITEAMSHWAKGHEIYERLDPGLKARVHAIAERLAPK